MIKLLSNTIHNKTGVESKELLIPRLSANLQLSVERSNDDLLSAHYSNIVG